jgi:hypothetical protein
MLIAHLMISDSSCSRCGKKISDLQQGVEGWTADPHWYYTVMKNDEYWMCEAYLEKELFEI